MQQSVKQTLSRMYSNPQSVQSLRPWQKAYAQAIADEEYYRSRIEHPQPGDSVEKLNTALAGALVGQGRYDEALELVEDGVGITRLKEAEARADKEWCDCRRDEPCPHKHDFGAVCHCRKCPVIIGKTWSEKYQEFANVIVCPSCDFLNITKESFL